MTGELREINSKVKPEVEFHAAVVCMLVWRTAGTKLGEPRYRIRDSRCGVLYNVHHSVGHDQCKHRHHHEYKDEAAR